MKGRVLAIDLGEKTMGIALSDEERITAQPLTTIQRVGIKKDMGAIAQLVEKHDVKEIVLGLPLHMDGSQSPMSLQVEEFARRLSGRVGIPIHTWDERLSTVIAEKALLEGDASRKKRKEVIDQVAATIILQGWLHAQP